MPCSPWVKSFDGMSLTQKSEKLQFLRRFYSPQPSLYKIFIPSRLIFIPSQPAYMEMMMDFAYIGAMLAFFLVTCAFAAACDKLGRNQ